MNNECRHINEKLIQAFLMLIGSSIWHIQHVEDALTHILLLRSRSKRGVELAPTMPIDCFSSIERIHLELLSES